MLLTAPGTVRDSARAFFTLSPYSLASPAHPFSLGLSFFFLLAPLSSSLFLAPE